MATCQAVADVLDEAIKSLAALDLEKLQILQQRATVLAQSNLIPDEAAIALIRTKRRVLELVLQGSASNLNALNRIFGRNTRDTWER